MELNENTTLSYSNGKFLTDYKLDSTTYSGWNWCYPYVERWYPTTYYTYWVKEDSKIEQAFKIVQKLMNKKIIEKITLKKFIELVNEIAKIL
jgi:hypothetical protein